jgi:hypothetical protein
MADTNPVVAGLAAYIENRDFPLVGKLQYNPELTANEVTVQLGVKGSSKLHFMETNVNLLAGASCDRNTPTDATTFTDKTITVSPIDIVENLCLERMVGKWLQIEMKIGDTVGKQELPAAIASVYWQEKEILLSQALDTADWQGDTTSLVGNLSRYDGWIKFIDAGSAVIGNTGGLTAINTGNIIAALQGMFLAIPTNIRRKNDLRIYLPQEWFDMYCIALINANLFHFTGSEGETKLFGTSVVLKPTYGLNGSNRMFLTYAANLVLGIDGENDTEFTVRLDPTTLKRIFVDAAFKRGTQVQFVEDVVSFDLTVS